MTFPTKYERVALEDDRVGTVNVLQTGHSKIQLVCVMKSDIGRCFAQHSHAVKQASFFGIEKWK